MNNILLNFYYYDTTLKSRDVIYSFKQFFYGFEYMFRSNHLNM